MLFLLSPAKSLDYDTPLADLPHTLPGFVEQSGQLIDVLREKSPQDIAQLMDLSDNDLLDILLERKPLPEKPLSEEALEVLRMLRH